MDTNPFDPTSGSGSGEAAGEGNLEAKHQTIVLNRLDCGAFFGLMLDVESVCTGGIGEGQGCLTAQWEDSSLCADLCNRAIYAIGA